MHNGALFFETYLASHAQATVLDIGSQDVNGSLRALASPGMNYVRLDFAAGPGVDLVLDDPYHLPVAYGSVDAVVSSSCFEYIEMFWLMFNEVLRVLKPEGLFYLNAPSNGEFHRYSVDCGASTRTLARPWCAGVFAQGGSRRCWSRSPSTSSATSGTTS